MDITKFTPLMTKNDEFNSNFLAICAEVTEYSKRAMVLRLAFVGKLLGAPSFNSAFEAQSEYAKTYFEGSLAEATKIGELCSNLAKAALKPVAGAGALDQPPS